MTQRNVDADGVGDGGEGETKGLAIIERRAVPRLLKCEPSRTAKWDSKAPVVVLSLVSIPIPHGYA
jgi:hypothetical protein